MAFVSIAHSPMLSASDLGHPRCLRSPWPELAHLVRTQAGCGQGETVVLRASVAMGATGSSPRRGPAARDNTYDRAGEQPSRQALETGCSAPGPGCVAISSCGTTVPQRV